MRLRHIEVFNAVMLSGSVSGAARLINVTQPAVSRTLQHAEVQFGFALFHRTKSRMVPTKEALTLYPHVERLFANLEDVQRLAATLKVGSDAHEIRVVSILALGHEVLPRAMSLFEAKFPKVNVSFKSLHSPQIVSSLVLQEADVGFGFGPASHPALVDEAIGEGRVLCIARKGKLAPKIVRAGTITLHQLASESVIGLDATDPIGTSIAQACRDAGVGLSAKISVQTYHAALALARNGLGLALVDSCTALSADLSLVDVVAVEPAIPVPVRAIRPSGKPGSVPVRAFCKAVEQVLTEARIHVTPSPEVPTAARPSRKRV